MAAVGGSSGPSGVSAGTRQAGHGADGVPVFTVRRAPGIPPVGVVRLSADGAAAHGPSPPHTLPETAHAHDFLVLVHAERTAGSLRLDGRERPVADGDVFVIAPGQVVEVGDPSGWARIAAWVVYFPADVVRAGHPGSVTSWRAHPLLFPFAQGGGRAQRLHVPPAQRPVWQARLTALDDELRARRDGYPEAVLAHLTLLLVDLSRLSADLGGDLRAVDEPLLAAVFDVIEARYHLAVSLSDVAAELGLSAGHLTTVVRRRTGRTVQQWITERRMQEARRLLADTDLTMAAVAARVGYRDVSYFIKRFRHDHGLAPLQWRRAGRS